MGITTFLIHICIFLKLQIVAILLANLVFFRLLVSRWREVYSFWRTLSSKFKKPYTSKIEVLNLRSSNTPETVDFPQLDTISQKKS